MYAYDVNGDGLNDIITALAAHAFGLAWYEQYREAGEIRFREHVFMNKDPNENRYGVKFSETPRHRPRGHGRRRPQGHRHRQALLVARADRRPRSQRRGGALLVQARPRRGQAASISSRRSIDNDSGVGTQVVATDVNGDGRPDVVVANKKGTFVHFQKPTGR